MNEITYIKRGCLKWLWLTLIVIIADQVTKNLAMQYLSLYQQKVILPVFSLTLAFNKGAAFSFLNHAGNLAGIIFGVFAAVVSLFLLGWLARLPQNRRFFAAALALILGGALGNLFDRIYHGHVIDFILLHLGSYYWPVFNLADTAVTIGILMFLVDAFFLQEKSKR